MVFDKIELKICSEADALQKQIDILREQLSNASLCHLAKKYDTVVRFFDMINNYVKTNCC